MSSDWIQSNRLALLAQATQYQKGIESLGQDLGMSVPEISGFGATVSLYDADMNAWLESKAATDALFETFTKDKSTLTSLMRKYNKRMQGSASINNAKRAEIGLPIPGTSTTVVPKKVLDLIANPNADGTVKLKWKRSGNSSNVVFVIESSNDSVNWNYVGNSTATQLTVSGFGPGVEAFFRIIATRGTLQATPSDPVVIYSGGEESELSLAA